MLLSADMMTIDRAPTPPYRGRGHAAYQHHGRRLPSTGSDHRIMDQWANSTSAEAGGAERNVVGYAVMTTTKAMTANLVLWSSQ